MIPIDLRRDYVKRWRKANPEKCRQYKVTWRKKNPEKVKQYRKLHYEKNKDKYRDQANKAAREWYIANREHVLVRTRKRRDANRVLHVSRRYTKEDSAHKLAERHRFGCQYCGSKEKLEVDHIFPKSRGGSSDLVNLQWLCKTCNRAKHTLSDSEFFDHIKKLVSIRRQFEDCEALSCKGIAA